MLRVTADVTSERILTFARRQPNVRLNIPDKEIVTLAVGLFVFGFSQLPYMISGSNFNVKDGLKF